MHKAKRKADKWLDDCKDLVLKKLPSQNNEDCEKILNEFITASPKTVNLKKFEEYIKANISVYDTWWQYKFKKKWAQQKFRVFCRKRQVLDKFFQSMQKKGQQKPVIAYGCSNISCNGRREVSVPVKYVKEKCKQYFETVDVNEFRTSLICPDCDQPLCKVVKEVNDENKVLEIRGLRRCSSTVCSRFSFQNRDLVGAKNILRCLVLKERPDSLTRKGEPALKSDTFTLRTKRPHVSILKKLSHVVQDVSLRLFSYRPTCHWWPESL